MKLTQKFTLSIPMKEFYEYAIPLVEKKTLHKAIKNELYMCSQGIINGEWGGSSSNWRKILYFELFRQNIIKQTELSISVFGVFKIN